ncbi:uncharacterized protein BDCG_06027 [Blastomyces dermatitidis ER-3]|uniref:Uncharacterized protein n=3 Tax=Blastomyces TaxID=229219 RepID=A0A179UU90_BLAGS|nr:uncharacterized protein BDBG_06591 [Blastomyces gilchristii SLH14081]XP_045277549.1 uncharacterized protein BDCG_06027 [Blastomyces dermatitidis ER-3]EGE78752.2 hypothetical protein BDDG_01689 [Blastomyces dermatitidis ATCC 18188]EQL36455.1 hypothetical protein BDFG_01854 [Blastomyces dermatitidis ATCC 26199]EEQ90907.2 hypothetical protein BDCG_06027 [Blastomyces dermatitidis ER-3]OAT10799.1 hypothetical protein BDBG_06591 [Blastomyces gilchristii SLH14081]
MYLAGLSPPSLQEDLDLIKIKGRQGTKVITGALKLGGCGAGRLKSEGIQSKLEWRDGIIADQIQLIPQITSCLSRKPGLKLPNQYIPGFRLRKVTKVGAGNGRIWA